MSAIPIGTLVPTAPPTVHDGAARPAVTLLDYGRSLLDRGRLPEALATFEAAAMASADPQIELLINQVHRRLVPRWHFAMLNDAARNQAFRRALSAVGVRGRSVLDVGSGSGLLAMMAADLGAERVWSCEAVEPIATLARRIVSANRMADVVEVIPRRSFDLVVGRDIDHPADVLVTETIDCGLLGERLLPVIEHARANLVAPGATIVPGRATVHGALLESAAVHRNNFAFEADAFDVTLFNLFSSLEYFPVRLDTWEHRIVSAPSDLFRFDFHVDPLGPGTTEVELVATDRATVHGVVLWFSVELAHGVTLTNAPSAPPSHWMQAVQCFELPRPVRPGERVRLLAEHDTTAVRVRIL